MILVTGATGFTGQYIIELLLNEGYNLTCFVRKSSNIDWLKQKNVSIVYGDLADYNSILNALNGIDVLVNIVSLGLGFAPNIVKACEEANVRRTIFISTTSIFTKLNPESKTIRLQAEEAIINSKLNYTILRPTMIYGSHKDRNMCRLVSLISKSRIIPVLGNGKFYQQPIFVKDVAKAVFLALKNPVSYNKRYNIAGYKELTYNDVIDITARALGRKVIKIHIPLSISLCLLELYEKISKRPKLKKEQALRLNEDKKFSITEIQEDLGFTPISFEEGIKIEIEEMKRNGVI